MKDNIIVVGGSGLVGRATINLKDIRKKFNIYVLDKQCKVNKKTVHFIKCDINKENFYKNIIKDVPKKSFVINLAARQYADNPPRKNRLNWFLKTNYYGSKNVLEFAKTLKAKGFIQFSTDMVYGIPTTTIISEEHPIKPIGEYGISKMKIENFINNNRKSFSFPISIIRPRLIIGKGRVGVLKNLFMFIKNNIPIPLIGSGKNYYQMVSDKDCARAIYLCLMANCPPEAFNLGSNVRENVENLLNNLILKCHSRSILIKTSAKFVKIIIKIFNLILIEILYKEQYELADKNFILDTKKSKKILKWYPIDDDAKMLNIAYKDWINQVK